MQHYLLDHFILYESAALSAGAFYFVRECSIKQLKSFFSDSFSKQNMVTVNRQSYVHTGYFSVVAAVSAEVSPTKSQLTFSLVISYLFESAYHMPT